MSRRRSSLLLIGLVLINSVSAQIDYGLCPGGPTPATIDSRWPTVPSRFEIFTEMVSMNEVTEISQAFSTERDAIVMNSRLGLLRFYWSFVTNEQFEVITAVADQQSKSKCYRQALSNDSETSISIPNSLSIKPSILLGYDALNQRNPSWGIRYDMNDTLRGIPTNVFTSCFYVSDIKATVSATYHLSDPTKFHPYQVGNQSIILQIEFQIKNQAGRLDALKYNVFRYTPNPSRFEERQALETPTGVFCPNRTLTKPVPSNIPERVSSNSEAFVPETSRSIFSTHNLYDTDAKFTRFDLWFPDPFGGPQWQHYTEIHDFSTGLSYQYNHTMNQCTVRDINAGLGDTETVDGRPDLLQLGSPQHLFLMDDITYQYTGEKACRDGVLCHVWIGEKVMENGRVEHREWYWAFNFHGTALPQWFPMKSVVNTYVNETLRNSFETTVFNYRRNPMTTFEIDYTLADCYRALGPAENFNLAVLTFTIDNEKNYPVLQNINYLRRQILETLVLQLRVRPIRLSNIIVDQDDANIVVTFTLLDVAPRTGPIENPIKESSLETLIQRLTTIIDSDSFAFHARYDTKQVTLYARINSLQIRHQSTKQIWKNTGPRITGLWLGFLFAGLVVGLIGAYALFNYLPKRTNKG